MDKNILRDGTKDSNNKNYPGFVPSSTDVLYNKWIKKPVPLITEIVSQKLMLLYKVNHVVISYGYKKNKASFNMTEYREKVFYNLPKILHCLEYCYCFIF